MSILAAKAAWKTAKGFLPTTPQQIITMVAVAGMCLTLGFCKGDDYRDAKWEAKVALAEVKDQATTIVANEGAAEDRVKDALRVQKNEEELIDVISETPDSLPSAVRIATACKRLRNSGYTEEQLPAVCGPQSGDGASAAPTN